MSVAKAKHLRKRRLDTLSEKHKIFVSAASLIASNLFVGILAVTILHLSAQRLGPTGYGQLVTVMAFVFFFALLADLGVTTVTARDVAKAPERAADIISQALGFRLALCAILAPALAIGAFTLYPRERSTVGLGVLVMSLDLFFVSVQAVTQAYYGGQVRNEVPSLLLVVTKVLYFAGTLAAVLTTHSVLALIVAYVAADAITAIISARLVRRQIPIRVSFVPAHWVGVMAAALPVGAMQVLNRLCSRLDSVLLSVLRDPKDVGIYGIAFNFTDALSNVPVYIMGSVLPALVKTIDRSALRAKLQVVFDVLIWLAIPIAVGGFELRSEIVSLVAGPGFQGADAPMSIMIFSLVVSFPQVVFVWGCVAINELKWLTPAVLVTVATNVAANLALIPPYGPTGAAVAQLLTQSVSLLLTGGIFWWKSRMMVRWWGAWGALLAGIGMGVCGLELHVVWSSGGAVVRPLAGTVTLGLVYCLLSVLLGAVPAGVWDMLKWVPGARRVRVLTRLRPTRWQERDEARKRRRGRHLS